MYTTEPEEITLTVDSQAISGKNRKLKAVWSMETQQDLRSMHNIQAENALAATLASEIQAEIDREILADLLPAQGEIPWGFKKKKRPKFRDITDEWQPSSIEEG